MMVVKSRLRRSFHVTHRDVVALIEALYLCQARNSETLLLRLVDLLHQMEGADAAPVGSGNAAAMPYGKRTDYARLLQEYNFECMQIEPEPQPLCAGDLMEGRTEAHTQLAGMMCEASV